MKIRFKTAQIFPFVISIICFIVPTFLSVYLFFKNEYLSQDTFSQMINIIFLCIIFEILSISSEHGLEIKYESKLMKKYWTIFWIKIGKWEQIENFTHIKIYRTQNTREFMFFPVRFGEINTVKTIVSLASANSEIALSITTNDNKAIRAAKIASRYLKLDIYDMLGRETEIYNEYEDTSHI